MPKKKKTCFCWPPDLSRIRPQHFSGADSVYSMCCLKKTLFWLSNNKTTSPFPTMPLEQKTAPKTKATWVTISEIKSYILTACHILSRVSAVLVSSGLLPSNVDRPSPSSHGTWVSIWSQRSSWAQHWLLGAWRIIPGLVSAWLITPIYKPWNGHL